MYMHEGVPSMTRGLLETQSTTFRTVFAITATCQKLWLHNLNFHKDSPVAAIPIESSISIPSQTLTC